MIRAHFTMKLNDLDAGLIEKLKSLFNDEHWLGYQYRDGEVIIISCRFHY